ncbi:cytochrome c oxidase assembly protein, partial [Haematococcus lacustris]
MAARGETGASTYRVTFTSGIIEKLAGLNRRKQHSPAPPPVPSPSSPIVNPEVLAIKQQDPRLSRALTHSRQVGQLLVKHEEEEAPKISQMADDLLQHHSERESCVACYKANSM